MFTIGPNVDNFHRLNVNAGQLIGLQKIGGAKTTLFYDHLRSGEPSLPADPSCERQYDHGNCSEQRFRTKRWTQQYNQLWSSSVTLTTMIFEVKGGTSQAETNASGKVIFDNFLAYK